jgi:uroporphyrinogen decarboxylase
VNGKERVLAVLQHRQADRVPWVPFAGVHAGQLKKHTAEEVLKDADKLFESLLAVNEIYRPDGQPVVFDLQIEAEILGCELLWQDETPPSVVSHPLVSGVELESLGLPGPDDGRLPLVLDVMKRMTATVGADTALYGLITGPFTLASHLRGTEVFMDMMLDPDRVTELMVFCEAVCKRMSELYIDAGMDVIAVVDPMVSQIGPDHFAQFCDGPLSTVFDFIREKGAFSAAFVCGNATRNVDGLCKTRPDCLSIDENIDIVEAKKITDRYNITIAGNIPLTTTMLLGTQMDNMKHVVDRLDEIGNGNFIMSPGCDMPYDTPPENVIGIAEAMRDPETARKLLEGYSGNGFDIDVELPDYGHLERPLVEVFTLDSAACAACMYMLNAAERGVEEFAGKVDMVEYKFTERENVARAMKLGVTKLPAIYINGELKFSSIIPGNEVLVAAIDSYLV